MQCVALFYAAIGLFIPALPKAVRRALCFDIQCEDNHIVFSCIMYFLELLSYMELVGS